MHLFNNFFTDNLLGVLLFNLSSSTIFVLLLVYVAKPKIFIVPIIIQPNDENDHFQFKLINKTLFPLYDINISLFYFETFSGPDNILNFRYKKIKIKTEKIEFISRNKIFNKHYGDNCIVINVYEEKLIENLRKTRNNLELKVTFKHQVSGLSNISIHRFIGTDIFFKGRFTQGNSKIFLSKL